MNDNIDELLKASEEFSKQFNDVMKEIEDEHEAYWNSLSKDDQLKAFCAVVRRIYQAEILDQGSYRHALYGVFEFGLESYAQAQMAGYLTIHNSIMSEDHDQRLLEAFCKKNNIEDAEKKIQDFWI